MKKVLHPCACCKAVCNQRKEEMQTGASTHGRALLFIEWNKRGRMRDPAGGQVQCESGGRGRKLEDHVQDLNQLARDCAIVMQLHSYKPIATH
jgi:hypothetical protein